MPRTTAQIVAAIRQVDHANSNKQGNRIYRMYWDSDRYIFDSASDFAQSSWQQFDTDQDAHYFGVWVNPVNMQVLTYVEGDWSLVVCEDVDHYHKELQAMCEFYGEGFIVKVIDPDTSEMTVHRQDRQQFFNNTPS